MARARQARLSRPLKYAAKTTSPRYASRQTGTFRTRRQAVARRARDAPSWWWVGGRTSPPFATIAKAAPQRRARPVLAFVLGSRTPPAAPAGTARVRGVCGARGHTAGRVTRQPSCHRAATAGWCTTIGELTEPLPDAERRPKPNVVGIPKAAGLRAHEPTRLQSGGRQTDEPDPSAGGVRVAADIRSPEPANDASCHAGSSAFGQGGPPAIDDPHS